MTTDHPNPSKPRRRWFQFSLRSLFVLLTVAGFYAWLFTLQPFLGMGIVGVVWFYAILTVVTVLMFWTRGKAIIGVAAGFILVNIPFVLPDAPAAVVDNITYLLIVDTTYLLFIGSHGAGICGGIDAIIREHRVAGWTAFILTSVSLFGMYCSIIFTI